MERRLGANLFDRDTRQVALTDLGKAMLDEARFALDVLAGVSRRAHRAALTTPTLVATAKPGIATGMLQRIVDAYAALPGAVRIETVVSGYREQADMVRDGRADVALLSSYFDQRGLDVEPLTTESRVAALPADHPLAQRDALQCRDLEGDPVPQWPQSTPAERAYWSGRDRTTGRTPLGEAVAGVLPPGPLVSDPSQLLEVVALRQAVALIPEALAADNPRPDIAYRPVTDATPYTVALAWSEGSRSRHLAQFVQAASDLYPPQRVASRTAGAATASATA
ncbi:LysR family transcriptional regulator [Streptomyces pseudoechinosporeus]